MTPRALLVRGLLAGLVAGFAAFLVAFTVGEPHVDTAIALEESGAAAAPADEAADGHSHGDEEGTVAHSHGDEEEGTTVSRDNQSTWGLLTGTVGIAVALGGLVALVSAGAVGRLGRLSPGQSTAVVSLVGFVAVALVPFLKYPATPPAVGDGETIGARTGAYFAFLLISLLAAVVAVVLAQRLHPRVGSYAAVLGGAGLFLVVVVVAAAALPTVDELGDFPAGTLWSFRLSSLFTLATMWAVIGVALTGLVGRLHRTDVATARRRDLAASL